MKRYGIIGHPVGHSVSPVLHNWGFALHGLDAAYGAFDVSPADLPACIRNVRERPLHGVSVTIPHKEAVLPLLDDVTPAARRVGAVNTLFWREGALVGENTDILGCPQALHGRAPSAALVLGAGGVARAVLAGLERMGVRELTVAARSLEKAAALARDFSCRLLSWEKAPEALAALGQGLVVNATPLGMKGERAEDSPLPESAWPTAVPGATACDTVYTPRETIFLRQARAHGWRSVDGLAFFLAQGLAQFLLWTGLELPVDQAEDVVARALAGSGSV